jgi:hypothetical protein
MINEAMFGPVTCQTSAMQHYAALRVAGAMRPGYATSYRRGTAI